MSSRELAIQKTKTVMGVLLKRSALSAIAALFPFLNLPGIGILTGFIVGKVVNFIIEQSEFQAFSYMIDERTDAQTKDFFNAAIELDKANKQKDPKAIRIAQDKLIRAHDRFGSLTS